MKVYASLLLVVVGLLGIGFGVQSRNADEKPAVLPEHKPEVVVFHTGSSVLVYPIAVGADGWRDIVARNFPSACVDQDADDDGVPASMDADEEESGELPQYHCAHEARAEQVQLELRGDEVALNHARIASRSGDIATVETAFGPIRVKLASDTQLSGEVLPGAEVRVLGAHDRQSPLDTIAASRVTVLTPAPIAMSLTQVLPGAAPLPELHPTLPPLQSEMAAFARR